MNATCHPKNTCPETVRGVNPTTGQELDPPFPCTTIDELDRAVRCATDAFRTYSRLPGKRRASLLEAIAANLEAGADPIIERAHTETALPKARLQGEMARTCYQLRFLGRLAEEGSWVDARVDHGAPDRKPQPKPDVRSMLRPVGPVAVFGSSNFPLAFSVAGGDTASALAAGNSVLFKVHPGHPGTSDMVGRAIQKAVQASGMPDGVFALLFDSGTGIGAALVQHPLVKAVGFTGSRRAGRMFVDLAAARPEPIPVFAEMGSVNPVFVLPHAMHERGAAIAEGIHASVILGVGQFCTNPGLVVFKADQAARAFQQRLAELFSNTAAGTMLTPAICRNFISGIEALKRVDGVSELAHGTTDNGPNRAAAVLLAVDAATFLREPLLAQEVFGPSTLLVRCQTEEEMLNVANSLEGQLTATVHASDAELAKGGDLIQALEAKAGRLIANGYPTGVEVCDAMVHGGPYPACSDARSTSVGARAIQRFARLVCYQNWPDRALPDELKDSNPLGLWRIVDGVPGRH
ncbi:MAG: aldehyde dehydrogenase (NADP(+)) [Verrucomicrobiota bacterium]|nr:aldehyde dehydrogenase (NADP(+)) [Verrucomicrobiota bacterium]